MNILQIKSLMIYVLPSPPLVSYSPRREKVALTLVGGEKVPHFKIKKGTRTFKGKRGTRTLGPSKGKLGPSGHWTRYCK